MASREKDASSVEVADGIVRRMLACGSRCQMIRFELAQGANIPSHVHPHEQIGYLAKGRLLMNVGGEEFELLEGEGYTVEPNVEHSVEVLEDSIAIDVFAPPRKDYCQ